MTTALDLGGKLPHLRAMTSQTITVAAFYRFHPLVDIAAIREKLLPALKAAGARGSVLLAEEGVNGT